jgi:PAS domain-containing protein
MQVGALVAFRDGSERLRVEQRTRQLVREQFARAKAEFQHGQLRDILSQAPAAICVTRGARHIVDFVNEHYESILEGRPVVGSSLAQALQGLPAETLDALDRSFESARPFSGSETPGEAVFGSAGKGRFVTFVFQPLLDDSGMVHGLIFHAVDVTEQVQARRELERQTAELQKTTERFSLAAEAGRLGAWEWEVHAGRVIWSTELERMHGLEPGTFPGRSKPINAISIPRTSRACSRRSRRQCRSANRTCSSIESSVRMARCAGLKREGACSSTIRVSRND